MNSTKWTPEMIVELRRRYPCEPSAIVALALGINLSKLQQKASYLGIKKERPHKTTSGVLHISGGVRRHKMR